MESTRKTEKRTKSEGVGYYIVSLPTSPVSVPTVFCLRLIRKRNVHKFLDIGKYFYKAKKGSFR